MNPEGGTRRSREIFLAFLWLGLTSFGGPIAHLGYFRTAFVARRRWLSDSDYADLVALCQFLPGPTSSQVGFALGWLRGGPTGAGLAWLAFTLPSAIALLLFAYGAQEVGGPVGAGVIHGLKVAAVAIVAHAVWSMAQTLCPDRTRAAIALAAVMLVTWVAGSTGQVTAIALGALAGLLLCRGGNSNAHGHLHFHLPRGWAIWAALLFIVLLLGLPLVVSLTGWHTLAVINAFYRAGALVFGGGHVVLPLLDAEVVQSGWITPDAFLAGYGAAQAVPGPLFTFAAYLGALLPGFPSGIFGALLALVFIFLPGFLLLVAILPAWNGFRGWPSAQAMMRGVNAAVVGILAAALYQPVFTSAIVAPPEFALALFGFLLLAIWRAPAWLVVVLMAAGGVWITAA